MTGVNVPLLRKAVEWAEAEAAKPFELCEWEQGRYILPNPSNAAAVASVFDDSASRASNNAVLWNEFSKAPECGTCFCIAGFIASQTDEKVTYDNADAIALEAIGGDWHAISLLFSATNSIEDVRRIAEDLAGERL